MTNFEEGKYQTHDLDRLKHQCMKSAWIAVALHKGLKFPKDYDHLNSAPDSVNGQVVHWTIGAVLYRMCELHDPIPQNTHTLTAWIDQNEQNEIMPFLACLVYANQLLLLPFCS